MADLSAIQPIKPPRASIYLIRVPFPIPPMDGLHDIYPMVFFVWVIIRVLAPSQAAAKFVYVQI